MRRPQYIRNVKKNPYNQTSPLYKRLTRLFSGPITRYKRQSAFIGRKADLDKYKFKSASGKAFKKSGSYNPFKDLQAGALANVARSERYMEFDQMEFETYLKSALDLYADEITTYNEFSEPLEIITPNEEIKQILTTLFYEVLNFELNAFVWTRAACKYGDLFMYLDIDPELGITNILVLPPAEIERIEGEDPTNPNYVQFQWNSGGITFENWQLAHIRLPGQDNYLPYGMSVLESARRIWKQYNLIKDAVMAYRVVRSPERYVFKIDVGGIEPKDVPSYIEAVRNEFRRNKVVDPDTGKVDLRYNAMNIMEDFFLPMRKGEETSIDILAGNQYHGDIDDLKMLRDEMFTALKIPAAYLSQQEGLEDKTSLAQKDVMFARTILRVQQAIKTELIKIAQIHLSTLGYKNKDLINFDLKFNNPSKIAEMQELEQLRTKFAIATEAVDTLFSNHWIYKNIFKLSDYEIKRLKIEKFEDIRYETALETFLTTAEGDMGGAMGGAAINPEAASGLGPMGALDGLPGPGEPTEAPEDESVLLAQPSASEIEARRMPAGSLVNKSAKRKDSTRERKPSQKSKRHRVNYHRVKPMSDKRKTTGPQKRNMNQKLGTSNELFRGLGVLDSISKINRPWEGTLIDDDELLLEEILNEDDLDNA